MMLVPSVILGFLLIFVVMIADGIFSSPAWTRGNQEVASPGTLKSSGEVAGTPDPSTSVDASRKVGDHRAVDDTELAA
jgi:hypothetical protein